MPVIARGNGFSISTDFGTSVVEGTVASGLQGGGSAITISVTQQVVSVRTVYVQIVPVSGQTGDFWDNFWSNKVGGEPADQFALSSFLGVEPSGVMSFNLNADTFAEGNETFEIRVYENNMDAAFGYRPLLAGRFTILDDDRVGTSGDDSLKGADYAERFDGLAGNDLLVGNGGNDTLNGGLGADTIEGGQGDDVYIVDDAGDMVVEAAGGGTDTLRSSVSMTLAANVENLVLLGGQNLSATGNALGNRLTGNAGANLIDGGAGADTMAGGVGNDIYVVDHAGDRITEQARAGIDQVRSSISHALTANVENLLLTGTAAINGQGNALANRIEGNASANILDGGAGADTMIGGAGNDVFFFDNAGDLAIEGAGGGIDQLRSSVNVTLAGGVENLMLLGNAALNGNGNGLNNILLGNAGANVLNGGLGADSLSGGAGNDVLIGGAGRDQLNGGAGADRFVFASLDASSAGPVGRDLVQGFAREQGDRIDLRMIDADSNRAGDQSFHLIGGAAFSGTAGELRYQRTGTTTVVMADIDGDGRADFSIGYDRAISFATSDFLL